MKYIKEVDTGELIPIPDASENKALSKLPDFADEEKFPEIRVTDDNFSANEIIIDLTNQLETEKKNNTVTHKFPIAEMIIAAIIIVGVVLLGTLGFKVIQSLEIEPITINYETYENNDSNVSALSEDENIFNEEHTAEEKTTESQNENTDEERKMKILAIVVIVPAVLILRKIIINNITILR